jgi:hypothetical protein
MNIHDIDELGYYSRQYSIVGKTYFQLLTQRNMEICF